MSPSSEQEMIATFLLAEIDSTRFSEKLQTSLTALRLNEALIRQPNLANQAENELRRQLLTDYRGWGTVESVFGGLPANDVSWCWIELTADDVRERVWTIAWYFEEEFGSRSVAAIAALHRGGDSGWVDALLESLRAGEIPPPPILLSTPKLDRLVILEGHYRLISYMSDPASVHFPIRAIVGTSARIAEWSEW